MAVFNGEQYLRPAIDSILGQTFRDFEFIILNDGSEDNSEDILRSYSDPRITLYRQKNKGLVPALIRGIELSKGEYIARMDADDVSLPDRLQKQVEFLDGYDDVGLVGTWSWEIDAEENRVRLHRPPQQDSRIKLELTLGNCFCHGSVMFRRHAVSRVGGYRHEFKWTEDYDLWLRISERFQVANLGEPLYLWRRLPTARSSAGADKTRAHAKVAQEFEIQRLLHGIDQEGYSIADLSGPGCRSAEVSSYAATLRCWGAKAVFQGDKEIARNLLWRSFRAQPMAFASWILSKDWREVFAELHLATIFSSYALGDLARIKSSIFPAALLNHAWLKNRGAISMMLESLLGRGAMSRIRSVAHRLTQRERKVGRSS